VVEPLPAVPVPPNAKRTTRPRLLFAAGVIGVILGGFGATYAITTAPLLIGSRDGYVRAFRDRLALEAPPDTPAADVATTAEKEADARYARRNAELPLMAVELIVSCLLFAGCTRALRGDAWGASAWALAATVAIPYQLLSTALMIVQARDLERVCVTLPQSLSLARLVWLQLQTLGGLTLAGGKLLYFAGVLFYLRRPSVKALFGGGNLR
jgi:hypothetical protein